MAVLQLGVRILCILYVAFMFTVFWDMYRSHHPIPCYSESNQCLKNYVYKTPRPLLKLWVYSSTSPSLKARDLSLVWELNGFRPHQSFTKDVTVRIPSGWQDCGPVFLHVLLAPMEEEEERGETNPFDANWMVSEIGNITEYTHHKESVAGDHLTCHWRSCATLVMMTEDVTFDREVLPAELADYTVPYEDQYLPMLLVDEMHFRTKDLLPLNTTCKEMPLKISYTPVSYGKFRMALNMTKLINTEDNDMTEKDIDDLKQVYPSLVPSIIVVLFHLLLLVLAVESDVSFWQERKTMAGLSTQTVIWGSVSTIVFFLHAMDDGKTVTVSKVIVGFLVFVEIWKVLKVFQAKVSWTEWRLVYDNAGFGNRELDTQTYDSQAMRCLSCVLYPLWVSVIIYSVKHNFQNGWCTFCIETLYNGFYSFGFLFKLPQVFINYKLKSVDDLPWKVIMYLAFITVIGYIYRFVLMLPVSDDGHLFIDDIIFIIYFYQAWLYSH